VYGVVLEQDSRGVDLVKTRGLREQLQINR